MTFFDDQVAVGEAAARRRAAEAAEAERRERSFRQEIQALSAAHERQLELLLVQAQRLLQGVPSAAVLRLDHAWTKEPTWWGRWWREDVTRYGFEAVELGRAWQLPLELRWHGEPDSDGRTPSYTSWLVLVGGSAPQLLKASCSCLLKNVTDGTWGAVGDTPVPLELRPDVWFKPKPTHPRFSISFDNVRLGPGGLGLWAQDYERVGHPDLGVHLHGKGPAEPLSQALPRVVGELRVQAGVA